MLPLDFIGGMDYRSVPSNYCAHKFRDQLKASTSTREGCRHNVHGTRHCDLPASCWIVDPNALHFIDFHIAKNGIPDRESVVMVRDSHWKDGSPGRSTAVLEPAGRGVQGN